MRTKEENNKFVIESMKIVTACRPNNRMSILHGSQE